MSFTLIDYLVVSTPLLATLVYLHYHRLHTLALIRFLVLNRDHPDPKVIVDTHNNPYTLPTPPDDLD